MRNPSQLLPHHYLLPQMDATPPDFALPPGVISSPWESTTTIANVLSVVSVIAIVTTVFTIVKCMNKTIRPLPTVPAASMERFLSNMAREKPIPLPTVPAASMERFLSNMAREKPIRFSPHHLTVFTNNFSTVLGSGGFGVVYKGQFPGGDLVAVKVLKNGSDKSVEEQFMAEVSTIGRTYHMNLVRLYGFCFDTNMKALVYEYMDNGSLDRLLFSENQLVDWGKLHDIAIGTAKGIAYLHEGCEKMIIHYDIKPENVLLDDNLNPKVADFGLAKLCNRDRSQVSKTRFRGTPGYAAPELHMPYPMTHKCDVYSFGMLLFEIVGRRRNHDAELSDTRLWLPRWTWIRFEKNELLEMLSFCGIEEKDREKAERMCIVALWCVQYLSGARPSMSTVVKMLEGGMEIDPPPNPFRYLESHGEIHLVNGSQEDSDPSS